MSHRIVNARPHTAIIMAAGAGTRIGNRPKCLLERDGISLIERLVRLLAGEGLSHVVVVLGHHASRVARQLEKIRDEATRPVDLRWVINPRPDEGPGSSLRTGLCALPERVESVMVALADQPLIEGRDIAQLVDIWCEKAPEISLLVPLYQGAPGHPIVLDRRVMHDVMQFPKGEGVREWRQRHPDQVQVMVVDHPRCTMDIDEEADCRALADGSGLSLVWPADLR